MTNSQEATVAAYLKAKKQATLAGKIVTGILIAAGAAFITWGGIQTDNTDAAFNKAQTAFSASFEKQNKATDAFTRAAALNKANTAKLTDASFALASNATAYFGSPTLDGMLNDRVTEATDALMSSAANLDTASATLNTTKGEVGAAKTIRESAAIETQNAHLVLYVGILGTVVAVIISGVTTFALARSARRARAAFN